MAHRRATIKLLDEVNCVIHGLSSDHILYFYDAYARKAPNYFFQPRYKLGQWDGKIRYFHKSGKTYSYLLEEIVPKLTGLEYEVDIQDERKGAFVEVPLVTKDYFAHILNEAGEPYEFRPYQVDALNSTLPHGGGVIIAGTGSGKTYMNAAIADSYAKQGLKTITIVPSIDLIDQTIEVFRDLGLSVGGYSGESKDISKINTVSTWQSLQNNPVIMKNFDVVIVDECHGLRGNQLTELLNKHGSHIVHRFGLTGTLPKEETDKMAVHIAVGPVRYVIPAHTLIEQGYLATLEITTYQLMEHIEDGYFPDYQAEKAYLHTNKQRLSWIAALIDEKRNAKKGNVLCLVDDVQFGKKLQKLIRGSTFLYGEDKKSIRKQAYQLFEDNNDVTVIATVQIAGTGISIDRIFNLFLIDLGKSYIRIIQTIGRGLRKGKDKDHVDVTDICSDLKYSKSHLRERGKYYKEARYPHKKVKVEYKDKPLN